MPKRTDAVFGPLFGLSPSEVGPGLLELVARQAGRRRPADLLAQRDRDGFVEPSMLDQRTIHRLDGLALDVAHEFEAVQLGPVSPLGTCSVVAATHQDRVLTALRGTEVVADPTNALALECARRLGRQQPGEASSAVRLCTLHQVLRAQPLPPDEGFSRHFRMFALAEAGRSKAEHAFEVDAIVRHVSVFDRLFDRLGEMDLRFPNRRAVLHAASSEEALATRVRAALRSALPEVALQEVPLETPYYDGVRVLFGADDASGVFVPIGDTGRFDWVAELTSNRRLRFVASGLGIQLAPLRFRATVSP